MIRCCRWAAAGLVAATLATLALAAEAPQAGTPFRVRVEAARHSQVRFSGSYTTGGKTIAVQAATTPWEYLSETGEAVTGAFHADDAEKPIRVEIVAGAGTAAKPAAEAKGAAIEFAWGPEGQGPRFVDLPGRGGAKHAAK